jgi:hypothetical protein
MRVLLGILLTLLWRIVGRAIWRRWRAFDELPADLKRRSY